MTSTGLGNYSGADRVHEVMAQLNNSYAQFRKKTGTEDPQGTSSDVPNSSKNIETKPGVESIRLTAQLSAESAADVPEVESNIASLADTKHIEATKNKVFSGFFDKINLAIAQETDLKKIEAEYLKLEELVLTEFNKLCTVQGSELFDKIDKAIEDLELKIQNHWEHCSKQHALNIARVASAVNTYEGALTEAVQGALTEYFANSHPSSMYNLIERSKRKAEAAVKMETQDFGKFRPMFAQQINSATQQVRKQAKIVKNLVTSFQNRMTTKMSFFNCLSEIEFLLYASESKVIAVNGFRDFKDSIFHSFLENSLTSKSLKLEQRNRSIRRCEINIALEAIQNVIKFYEIEMQRFCNKKVHTSQVLEQFHNNLSQAAVESFVSACKFNPASGISNARCTLKLQSSLQALFNVFVNENSINSEKASTLLKITSEAISEYQKIMGEQLNGRSVSEDQLKQFHDCALDHVLRVFNLDIQEVADNCKEQIESLRNSITDKYWPDWQQVNANLRQLEAQKEAEEKAERERRLREQEQARRDKVTRVEAEAKRRLQSEAAGKEQTHAAIYRLTESRNADEANVQHDQSTGSAAGDVSKETVNEENTLNCISIELGLMFVRAGWMSPKGDSGRLPLQGERSQLSSFIGVNNNNIVFGEEARARTCSQTISLADLVAEMNVTVERTLIIDGKKFKLRLEHLTALLLAHVKQKCEEFLEASVSRTIITIPGWYNQELRRATKDAAFLAGFVENQLILEASAVATTWYQHLKNQPNPIIPNTLLVAVVSDFSFDVAVFEVDKTSVAMKKNVARMNFYMGNESTEVDPTAIVQESTFPYDEVADQAIFVKSIGYEGNLNMDCMRGCSKTPVKAIRETRIRGATLYSGPLRHLELKEATTYALLCKDWKGKVYKVCEPGDFLCASGSRRFVVDVHLSVLPSSRVKFTVWERVDDVERCIGSVEVEPPREDFKKFKLTFLIDPEGILSVEAKYGSTSPSLEFKTYNLDDSELKIAEELLAGLSKSEEKAKAEMSRQEAFQNLKAIEQRLRKSIGDSERIQSILPEIVSNVDKIVEKNKGSSSLDVLEDAAEKLSKYSEKYCREKILSILKSGILKSVDKIVKGITESSSLDVLENAVDRLSKYSEKYCEK